MARKPSEVGILEGENLKAIEEYIKAVEDRLEKIIKFENMIMIEGNSNYRLIADTDKDGKSGWWKHVEEARASMENRIRCLKTYRDVASLIRTDYVFDNERLKEYTNYILYDKFSSDSLKIKEYDAYVEIAIYRIKNPEAEYKKRHFGWGPEDKVVDHLNLAILREGHFIRDAISDIIRGNRKESEKYEDKDVIILEEIRDRAFSKQYRKHIKDLNDGIEKGEAFKSKRSDRNIKTLTFWVCVNVISSAISFIFGMIVTLYFNMGNTTVVKNKEKTPMSIIKHPAAMPNKANTEKTNPMKRSQKPKEQNQAK